MNDDSISEPNSDLIRLRSEIKTMHEKNDKPVFFGLLIAPCLMGVAWLISGEINTVKIVGYWVVWVSFIVFGIAYAYCMSQYKKLKDVSQEYYAEVPGAFGPVKKQYMTQYDFSRFDLAQIRAYKKLKLSAGILWLAGLALFGWFLVSITLNSFVRS